MIELAVIVGIMLNCVSTVAIVLLNKYLWTAYRFRYMAFLSAWHFVGTSLGTRAAHAMGVFDAKPAQVRQVLPIVLSSAGSVVFMNLNLAWNSVGFCQMSKLLCIPFILVVNYYLYKQTVPLALLVTLGVMLIGVGLATVSDVELNMVGSVFAGCGIICTAAAQISTNKIMNALRMDAMQMLMHTAHLIAAFMFFISPMFDQWQGPEGLMEFDWSIPVVSLIVGTSTLAIVVNVTNYLVLAKTSPITYQVLGHFKTVSILVLGFVVFDYPIIYKNILGIAIALGAMIVYSDLKRRIAEAATASSGMNKLSSSETPAALSNASGSSSSSLPLSSILPSTKHHADDDDDNDEDGGSSSVNKLSGSSIGSSKKNMSESSNSEVHSRSSKK